jgi:diadenosine tetraphosphate (Ap4A) HIT family hydrolase
VGGTTDFFISLCLGPLVEGHVIVSPKEHIPGLIDFRQDTLIEFKKVKDALRTVLIQNYGACSFFEHGHHERESHEKYHSHAHFHAVPTNVDITDFLDEQNYPTFNAGYTTGLEIQGEYLFYEAPTGSHRFYHLNLKPEKQFVRKMIATKLGISPNQADWKLFPKYDIMQKTRRKLLDQIENALK